MREHAQFSDSSPQPLVSRTEWFVVAVLGAAALAARLLLDAPLAAWCHEVAVPPRAPWLVAVGEMGRFWTPLWLILLFIWATNRRRALPSAVVALAFVAVVVTALKFAVHRVRPVEVNEVFSDHSILGFFMRSYSFPSGDAATAFAIGAVFMLFLAGHWRVLPMLAAGGVCVTRLLLERHYLSDVLGGAAVGILCAGVASTLCRRWLCRRPLPLFRHWRRMCGGGALLLLAADILLHGSVCAWFLNGFGATVVVLLLLAKGPAWFRWLRARDAAERAGRILPAAGVGFVLVAIGAIAILPTLNWTTLYDRDEGYYAECAREIASVHSALVPQFNGQPWMEKPPLSFWLMALSMKALGEREFAVRLPSALCALLAVWLTFQLARRMYSLRAAAISALVLGTAVLYGIVARMALVDMPLLCCMLLSMIGLWKIVAGGRHGGLLLFYLGCGLGGLTKGFLGVALPILAAAGYLLWTRRWALIGKMRPFLGAIIILAVVGAWAIPVCIRTQGDYFRELVWVRTIQPIFVPLQGHGGGNLAGYLALLPVYVPILLLGFLPWSVFLMPATRRLGDEGWRTDRPAFLCGWTLAQLTAFSLVGTKLPHYVLPIIPALAIAVGAALADAFDAPRDAPFHRSERWTSTAFATGGAFVCLALLAIPLATGFNDEWPWFLPAAVVALLGGWRTGRAVHSGQAARAVCLAASASVLCFALLWQLALPRFESGKSAARTAAVIKALYKGQWRDLRVATLGYREVSFVFYLKRPVTILGRREEIESFLSQPGPAAIIMTAKEQKRLKRLATPFEKIWQTRAWIPERNSWTDLMVISNGK